jgi:hypothetical protein
MEKDLMLLSDSGRGSWTHRAIALGIFTLALPQAIYAQDGNVVGAWGALLLLPVPPLWAMLRTDGLKISFLLWCGALLLYEYGSYIPLPLGLHANRGLYSLLLLLLPYPAWMIHLVVRRKRPSQRS